MGPSIVVPTLSVPQKGTILCLSLSIHRHVGSATIVIETYPCLTHLIQTHIRIPVKRTPIVGFPLVQNTLAVIGSVSDARTCKDRHFMT